MVYIPKSKASIKSAVQGAFVYKDNENPYVGKYIETSDGMFYAGDNIAQPGRPLKAAVENDIYLKSHATSSIYNSLSQANYNFMKKRVPFLSSKPQPTERDYETGFFTRYFFRKVNETNHYGEVNKSIYEDLVQRKGVYDYNLFEGGFIHWSIEDTKYPGDQKITNRKNLKVLERNFPGVEGLFPNLAEYKKTSHSLYTFGKELYYRNGREYIGSYHIHPEKGPMEGPKHTDAPHKRLFWKKQNQ